MTSRALGINAGRSIYGAYAVSAFGRNPLHRHQIRRMVAVRRDRGVVIYRAIRLSMDTAACRRRLAVLARDLRGLDAALRADRR